MTGLKVKYGNLYSCSADKTIRKWSLKDGTCELVFRNHVKTGFTCLSVSDRLVSGDLSGIVALWDIPNLTAAKDKHKSEKVRLEEEIARLRDLGIEQNQVGAGKSPLSSHFVAPLLTEKEKKDLIKEAKGVSKTKKLLHPYMVGDMSRVNAELELAKCNYNSFLVRNSSIEGMKRT